MPITPTPHARKRMQQRCISLEDLELAVTIGQVLYCAGAKFVFVGLRDIPAARRRELAHLEGVTLVLSTESDRVLTSYRNKGALRDLKRKLKRSSRPERMSA